MGERGAGGVGDAGLVLRANAVVGRTEEREQSWSLLAALASSLARSGGYCSCPTSVNHQRKAEEGEYAGASDHDTYLK